jgi:DNA-binding NarL/FixJ family response regulator
VLAAIILLQALTAMFFVGDAITDYRQGGHLDDIHLLAEAVAALALTGGVVFLMRELRRLLARMGDMETGLRIAHGEMVAVIDDFFARWSLSAAERDVALLLIKGLDNETIASLRGTAKGTVRAQSAAIYAKAGVDGRAQLISVFLEELLHDTLVKVDVAGVHGSFHQIDESRAPT